jgi:hypothetical protein
VVSTYTVKVAQAFVDQYAEWTRLADVADWIKVIPSDDGTAEIWLSKGAKPTPSPPTAEELERAMAAFSEALQS